MISRLALVTGAAKGIGKAICENLAQNKYSIIMVDIDESTLAQSLTELTNKYRDTNIQGEICDVSNTQAIEDLFKKLNSFIKMPDILVNNAGYGGPFHMIHEVSELEWEQVIHTNLKSIFNFTKQLLPDMKKNKWGRIVNIASVQGIVGARLSSSYVASKHGVVGYTKALAAEWGMYGITSNAVCPGYVDTQMGVQNNKIKEHFNTVIKRTPVAQIAQPYDIANLVAFLISEEARFINGSIIPIDGGMTADIGIT